MLSGKAVDGRVVAGNAGRSSGGMWLLLEYSGQLLMSVLATHNSFMGVYVYIYIYIYIYIYAHV